MYESLTALLNEIKSDSIGEWIVDRENDGSPEHPIQFPFIHYSECVSKFEHEVYTFEKEHPEFGLHGYGEILNEHGIEWGADSMKLADVSNLSGRTVMALLMGAIRAERFCDGALMGFFSDGSIEKWLNRLKEIDETGDVANQVITVDLCLMTDWERTKLRLPGRIRFINLEKYGKMPDAGTMRRISLLLLMVLDIRLTLNWISLLTAIRLRP